MSGIFTFNDRFEMIQFTTEDRIIVNPDGSNDPVKWSIKCGSYIEQDGIKRPGTIQAIWHYEHGDYIYFDASDIDIKYQAMG